MNKDNGISIELKELSPLLYQMKEESSQPFRVPSGYFDQLKSDVFSSIDSGMAEGLGKDSFKVPENYFEGLTDNIMAAIDAEETNTGKVIDLQPPRKRDAIPMRRWTSIAASVAIFITLGVLAARFISLGGIETQDFLVSGEEAYEYLEDNMLTLDSDDLYALVDLSDEDLNLDMTNEFEEELHQYLEENIDDLEDYLLTVEI